MADVQQVDLVVVGLGPGGEALANAAATAGLRVVAVDKRLVGGECPYFGCVPTKMMVRASDVVAEARRAAELAGEVTIRPELDAGRRAGRRAGDRPLGRPGRGRAAARASARPCCTASAGSTACGGSTVTPTDGSEPVDLRGREGRGAQPRHPTGDAAGRGARRHAVLDQPRRRAGHRAARLARGGRRRPDRLRAGPGVLPVRGAGDGGPARRPAAPGQRARGRGPARRGLHRRGHPGRHRVGPDHGVVRRRAVRAHPRHRRGARAPTRCSSPPAGSRTSTTSAWRRSGSTRPHGPSRSTTGCAPATGSG